jgi:polyhydroxyalkanoate synthesis regulator phasin
VARRRDLDAALDKADDVQPLQQGRGLRGLVGASGREELDVGTETELSTDESMELERCETIIERGLRTFFEVGTALLRIRELRLYRAEYATFEDYCQERWEMGRRYVNQIIAASQVRENLGAMAPKQLPENERQARPLARLEPEGQRAAWQQVLDSAAAEGRITAAHVEQVVKEMLGQAAPAAAASAAAEREAAPAQQMPAAVPANADAAALRHENAALRQRLADVQSVLEEYQEQITRAQNYKPTSDRGEAVSPLLRLIEQIYLTLIESEPDDTPGDERGKHPARTKQ